MESEERDRSKIPYVERRISGIFVVRGYKARIRSEDLGFAYYYPHLPQIQRVIIIPLPNDFDFSGIVDIKNPENTPNSILIVEDKRLPRYPGRKRWRIERVFREKGRLQPKRVKIKEGCKFDPESFVWVSKEKLEEMTKRDLYMDKFYVARLFCRDQNS